MTRRPISVTLDELNLRWLRGRARATADGNVSLALDRLISTARGCGDAPRVARSVIGTVALPADDSDFSQAKAAIRALFEESLSRPLVVRETDTPYPTPPEPRRSATKRRRRG